MEEKSVFSLIQNFPLDVDKRRRRKFIEQYVKKKQKVSNDSCIVRVITWEPESSVLATYINPMLMVKRYEEREIKFLLSTACECHWAMMQRKFSVL